MDVRKTALAYFGGGARADEWIDRALNDLNTHCRPHAVSRELPCSIMMSGVYIGGRFFESEGLRTALDGCTSILLFAVTLGVPADALLARAQVREMSYALALQACASALIEKQACILRHAAQEKYAAQGLYLRPQYAPGYDDFALDAQNDLLRMLDAGKRIGLGVTESGMLTPTKSICALCGLTRVPCSEPTHKCASCSMKNCAFRRE